MTWLQVWAVLQELPQTELAKQAKVLGVGVLLDADITRDPHTRQLYLTPINEAEARLPEEHQTGGTAGGAR